MSLCLAQIMDVEKFQVVFLLDTCTDSTGQRPLPYLRSLCLVCVRILLFLSQFPIKEHLGRVVWNYKLFNSHKPEKSVRARTSQFFECRSELLEKLFQEVQMTLEDGNKDKGCMMSSNKPVKQVYNALASTVQDFIWDAPEITSPVRPVSTKSSIGVSKRKPASCYGKLKQQEGAAARNLIFVCSPCPQTKEEVREFCCRPRAEAVGSSRDHCLDVLLAGELLPPALLSQLGSKGIVVHWVDTGDCHGNRHSCYSEEISGVSAVSKALEVVGGTVIPIGALVGSPTSNQSIHEVATRSAGPCLVEARIGGGGGGGDGSGEVFDTCVSSTGEKERLATVGDQLDLALPGDSIATNEMVAAEGDVHICPSSQQATRSTSTTSPPLSPSNQEREPNDRPSVGESTLRTKRSKSAANPSHELISSLLLPAASYLKRYLIGASDPSELSASSLEGTNLFWLCTNGGRILCILETHPMHQHVDSLLSPRPQPTDSLSTEVAMEVSTHTLVAPSPPRDGGQGKPALGDSQRKSSEDGSSRSKELKKSSKMAAPLDLSRPSGGKSNGTKPRRKLNVPLRQGRKRAASGLLKKNGSGNSTDSMESSVRSGTISSQSCSLQRCEVKGVGMTASHAAVALGVMKQSDTPLSWLSATRVYSCLGLFVPRKTRNKAVKLEFASHQSDDHGSTTDKGSEHTPADVNRKEALSDVNCNPGPTTALPSSPLAMHPPTTVFLSSLPMSAGIGDSRSVEVGSSQLSRSPPTASDETHQKRAPKTPTRSSPYEHARRSSPQIHLYRHQLTPPSQHTSTKPSPGSTPTGSLTHKRSNRSPLSCSGLRMSPRLHPKVLLQREAGTSIGGPPLCGIWPLGDDHSSLLSSDKREGLVSTARASLSEAPSTPKPCRGLGQTHCQNSLPSPVRDGSDDAAINPQTPPSSALLAVTRHKSPMLAATSVSGRNQSPRMSDAPGAGKPETRDSNPDSCSTNGSLPASEAKVIAQDRDPELLPSVEPQPVASAECLPGIPGNISSTAGQDNLQWMQPGESLALSGRYFSRQFQGLCLWLAKNGFLLVVSLAPSSLAVLQPATTLVATLSLVKPQHHNNLLKKLAHSQLPPGTTPQGSRPAPSEPPGTTSSVDGQSVSPRRRIVLEGEARKRKIGDGTDTGNFEESAPKPPGGCPLERKGEVLRASLTDSDLRVGGSSGEETAAVQRFITRHATDPELYVSLQLLYHSHPERRKELADSLHSTLLQSLIDSPPFTALSLLPWYPYLRSCGIGEQTMEDLRRVQLECEGEGDGVYLDRLQLLCSLKELYTSGLTNRLACRSGDGRGKEEEEEEGEEMEDQNKELQEGLDGMDSKESEAASECLPRPASLEELLERVRSDYREQIHTSADSEGLQSWAARTMTAVRSDFPRLVSMEAYGEMSGRGGGEGWTKEGEENGGNGSELAVKEEVERVKNGAEERGRIGRAGDMKEEEEGEEARVLERLWKWITSHVLLSSAQLKEKYKVMSSDGDYEGLAGRIQEYQLQVFLHLEALRVCTGVNYDAAAVAEELTLLLRRISLLTNPQVIGYCLRKIILPLYTDSCKAVLTETFEGLMLPLPPDLYNSPDVERDGVSSLASPHIAPGYDSEGEDRVWSLQGPVLPPQLVSARSLTRRTSFQDVQTQRQITVPARRIKKKKKEKEMGTKFSMPTSRVELELPDKRTSLEVKGRRVCRSLFSRSHSTSEEVVAVGGKGKRKRTLDEGEGQGTKRPRGFQRHHTIADVLVKETPLKKQLVQNYRQSKLQRLRSKTQIEPNSGVMVIGESPRRSFYSAPKIVRSSTAFKTPPHMSHTVTTNSRLALNKEPSPAALHALLHGRILSESPEPFSSTRSSLVTAPEGDSSIQATPVADMEVGESPDLFEESKKPSVETVVSKPTVSFASRAARMLTYDSEDPLVRNRLPKSILKTPDKGSKEQSNCSSGSGFAAIPSKGVFFLSAALDPSIENESASMAAFTLSTPTKEDPVDFHQAFHPEGNY